MDNGAEKQSFSLFTNIKSVTVIVDLNDPQWEKCLPLLSSLGDSQIETEWIFIDLQRKRSEGRWAAPASQTFYKNDFGFINNTIKSNFLRMAIGKETDILICLIEETDKRIEAIVTGNKSRIKIGRIDLPSHPFDFIIESPENANCSQADMMNAFISYLNTVTWK